MGNLLCTGLILRFRAFPTPRRLHHAHHSLPAGMDVDVLHRNLLLALAAVAIECLEQRGEGAGELVRLGEVIASALEGLFADHGAAIAFHRRVVSRDQLRRHHTFQFVLRPDPDQSCDRGGVLLFLCLTIGTLQPKRLKCLVTEQIVPVIGM
ncbi:MAG: hypothetical protein AB7L36_10825 [Sphingomonadaceae bacterium]